MLTDDDLARYRSLLWREASIATAEAVPLLDEVLRLRATDDALRELLVTMRCCEDAGCFLVGLPEPLRTKLRRAFAIEHDWTDAAAAPTDVLRVAADQAVETGLLHGASARRYARLGQDRLASEYQDRAREEREFAVTLWQELWRREPATEGQFSTAAADVAIDFARRSVAVVPFDGPNTFLRFEPCATGREWRWVEDERGTAARFVHPLADLVGCFLDRAGLGREP